MSYEGRREHLNYERSAFGGGSLHVLFGKLQSVIDLILLIFFILFGSPARPCKTFWITNGESDVMLEFSSEASMMIKRGNV